MSTQTSLEHTGPEIAPSTVIVSQELKKCYGDQIVLDAPDTIEISQGLTAIVGESGSGKSTYLNMLAGFVTPTEGSVIHYHEGEPMFTVTGEQSLGRVAHIGSWITRKILVQTPEEKRSAAYRSNHVGYIAQQPALHPNLTMENYIRLTHEIRGNNLKPERFNELARRLGVVSLLGKKPSEISGGEEQRGAIMSALVHEPRLVFADEPTSALDTENSKNTIQVFREFCDKGGSVIMVTHNLNLVQGYADHTITTANGKIVEVS